MSFNYNSVRNILPIPTEITRTVSNASFYAPLSIYQRFDRLSSGGDLDLFGTSVARSSVQLQMVFVRKVYMITLCQCLSIAFLTAVFMHFSPWHGKSQYIWWILLVPAGLLLLFAAWYLWTQYYQLSKTVRAVILVIYLFLMAFILSDIIAKTFQTYGILVFTMICFGVSSSGIYTYQTRYKFQGTKPFVCSIAAVCIISVGLREAYQLDPMQILGPIALSSFICSYFILELYYVMETMTVEDYILANLSFHMDLAYPINSIHHFCELLDHADNFPEYFNPDQPT